VECTADCVVGLGSKASGEMTMSFGVVDILSFRELSRMMAREKLIPMIGGVYR
jgi:hypothetical protein